MDQQAHVVDYDAHGRYDYNCGGITFFTGPAPGPSVCKRCDQPLVKRTALDTAIAAAKRDLAEKVLAAINGERLHDDLDNDGDKGYMRAIEDVTTAVQRLFTESGVAVEREG